MKTKAGEKTFSIFPPPPPRGPIRLSPDQISVLASRQKGVGGETRGEKLLFHTTKGYPSFRKKGKLTDAVLWILNERGKWKWKRPAVRDKYPVQVLILCTYYAAELGTCGYFNLILLNNEKFDFCMFL